LLSACAAPVWVSKDGLPTNKNTLADAIGQCDFEKRRKEALAYIDRLNRTPANITTTENQAAQTSPNMDKDTIECMARKGFTLP